MVLDQIGDFALGDFNGDPIDALVDGDYISFRLSRQTPIGELSMDYEGIVEGDRMYGDFEILDGPDKGKKEKWSATKLNISINGAWSVKLGTPRSRIEEGSLIIEQEENSNEAVGTLNGVPVVILINGDNIEFTVTASTEDGIISREFSGFVEGRSIYGDFLIKNGVRAGLRDKWKATRE